MPVPTAAQPIFLTRTYIRELPIRWTALDAYARRHHLSDDAFADFEHIISEMDKEYLAVMIEQRNKPESE